MKISPTQLTKTCTICKEVKPLSVEFWRLDPKQGSGFRPDCVECCKARSRAHYYANRERRLAQAKVYREENRDQVVAKLREIHATKMADPVRALAERTKRQLWYQANKPMVRQQLKDRRKSDPKFRIRELVGAKFRQFVKGKPQGGFQAIVGYTTNDLYRHLERQFTPEMSWANYGSVWEIDHILPVSSFDLPDEIAACWALSNLRPLGCGPNRRKSNSRPLLC